MRKVSIIIACSILASAPSALLAKDDGKEAATQSKSERDAKKMRCKRIQVTGSLIKKRLCRTNAEWAAIAKSEGREARTMIDHANQGTTSGR